MLPLANYLPIERLAVINFSVGKAINHDKPITTILYKKEIRTGRRI